MSEKETSKERLTKTASRLFQLQGYHATGLNQITKESGAPKGSLYYYFPQGKEQLALESVQLTTKFVLEQITAGLHQSPDPIDAIPAFILDMAERIHREGYQGGVPIASIALETSLISDSLRESCQNAYASFQEAFAQKLREGGFAEEQAWELGMVINAMVEGAFLLSFTMQDSAPLRAVAKRIPALLQAPAVTE